MKRQTTKTPLSDFCQSSHTIHLSLILIGLGTRLHREEKTQGPSNIEPKLGTVETIKTLLLLAALTLI